MLKSAIYLTVLVWYVSGTIIYPTRGNHRTCKTLTCSYGTVCVQKVRYCVTSPCKQPKPTCVVAEVERSNACALLNCPKGSKCKQEVRQCVSPPCQQPPAICIKVSTPSHPTLCPPGLSPDLHMGRTRNCVSDGQCGPGSKCFSSSVHGPFVCCSEKSAKTTLPSLPRLIYPQPHQPNVSVPRLVIQHLGPQQKPIPLVTAPQQHVAHQHGTNHNQPPPTHYRHGPPPTQPIAQSQRPVYHPQQIRHQHQPIQQLHTGQVRHQTLAQPQTKPYPVMNNQQSQHFHHRILQPPQYQRDIGAQPYLQSEPVNQQSSYTQRDPQSRRYPEQWNRQQREPEVEIANPRPAKVEVRKGQSGSSPTSSQNCPTGYLPDFQRGREIPCIQDNHCQPGSRCLSVTGRRYVCCASETFSPIQRRPVAEPMPRYDINRQQIVSYGNIQPPPRLSYPLPSETSVINHSSRRQQYPNQQRQPIDRISFNSQYSPNKQPYSPYRIPGSNIQSRQPAQPPNKKSAPGQTTCPSGFTANQVNGQNMVCASASQCPEGSECKSTGLFQGSICCLKSSGMRQNSLFIPRR